MTNEPAKRLREWTFMYDDYERGTVFITNDPTGEQKALVSGITEAEALAVIAALAAERKGWCSDLESPHVHLSQIDSPTSTPERSIPMFKRIRWAIRSFLRRHDGSSPRRPRRDGGYGWPQP